MTQKSPTRAYGKIILWKDKEGYGFIACGEQKIFFHISAFYYKNRRPQKGEAVCFYIAQKNNKTEATRVVLAEDAYAMDRAHPIDMGHRPRWFDFSIFVAFTLLFWAVLMHYSWVLVVTSMCLSVLSALLYGYDKQFAQMGHRRIPEATLHVASLLGGWPGALIARPLFNHKTTKNRFIIFLWMSIVINLTGIYVFVRYFLAGV